MIAGLRTYKPSSLIIREINENKYDFNCIYYLSRMSLIGNY